jgi:hypothetical protein
VLERYPRMLILKLNGTALAPITHDLFRDASHGNDDIAEQLLLPPQPTIVVVFEHRTAALS